MQLTKKPFVSAALACGFAACVAAPLTANAQSITSVEAQQIATDAYVYGYSLITTEVTRVQMSNVPKVGGFNSPTGQFVNVPRYPPADYRGVSAPNADTLYSVTWLDLSEPQVFSHPDMGSRFYLFEITDLWMSDSESSPSKRTAGGATARNGAAINRKPGLDEIASHIHPSSAPEPDGRQALRRRPAPAHNKPAAEAELAVLPERRRATPRR